MALGVSRRMTGMVGMGGYREGRHGKEKCRDGGANPDLYSHGRRAPVGSKAHERAGKRELGVREGGDTRWPPLTRGG